MLYYLSFFAALGAGLLFLVAIGVPSVKAPWLSVAAAMAFLGLVRPWWFWTDPRVERLRRSYGDRGVQLFYLGLAVVLLALGFLTDFPFEKL